MNLQNHPYRRAVVLSVVAATAVLWSVPVDAAGAVTIGGVSRSGSILTVTGSATFANQPFVMLGTDPAGDQAIPGTDNLGLDITGFSMRATAGGGLTLRWQLSKLAPDLNRGVDVAYGKGFCVEPSDEPNCWMFEFDDLVGAAGTGVRGWKCPDETCAITAADFAYNGAADGYDVGAKAASATVPLEAIGAAPGSVLRPATLTPVAPGNAGDLGPVFATTPWWYLENIGHPYPDRTTIDAAFEVPTRDVTLAIGASGQQPDAVTYTSPAVVAEDGSSFSGDIDVGSLAPGTYTLYARACFGAGNCAYATRDVTV